MKYRSRSLAVLFHRHRFRLRPLTFAWLLNRVIASLNKVCSAADGISDFDHTFTSTGAIRAFYTVCIAARVNFGCANGTILYFLIDF